MQIARFVDPLDLRAVFSYLCVASKLLGGILLVPFLVGLAVQEFSVSALFGGLAVGAYLLGRIGEPAKKPDLRPKEALVIAALVYLLFAITGAVAFLPAASFWDGFFETLSGFTTAGLTVVDVETLPSTLLFFRAYAQWIGGAGIIVLSLVILLGPGKAAFELYASEFKRENVAGSVIATARVVVKVYLLLTGIGFLGLLVLGLGFFDAILHAMTSVSTGGFSSHSDSIGYFDQPTVALGIAVLMLLGATSFPLYYLTYHEGFKRFFSDLQFRYLITIAVIATLLLIIIQNWQPSSYLSSFFHATSALTGTGFQISQPASWPESTRYVSLFLMLLGGSAGSTTGAIKLFRLIIIVQLVIWLVYRRMLPEEARVPIKYGEIVVTDHEIKEILGFFALYLALFIFSGFLLSLGGFRIEDALFESASALGTVGLSVGITSPDLPLWAKLVLAFNMWAGRLEIIPLLLLFYPGHWKRARRRA